MKTDKLSNICTY